MIKKTIHSVLRYFAGHRSYKWVLYEIKRMVDMDLSVKVLNTCRFRNNIETLSISAPGKGKKIVIVSPHQDDETIGAGGTLLKSSKQGADISCIYVTDGAFATKNISKDEMRKLRESEAKTVWQELGGKPIFLRFRDRETPLTNEAACLLADHINHENPDIIFIPFLLDNHIEHRRVNHLFWLTNGKLRKEGVELWAFPVWSEIIPNIAIDITDVIEEKVRINRLWKSQNSVLDVGHFAKALSAYNCRYIQTKEPTFWELFFVVPLSEYYQLGNIYFNNPLKEIYYDYDNWMKLIKSKG